MKHLIFAISLSIVAFSPLTHADDFDDRARAADAQARAQRKQEFEMKKREVTAVGKAKFQKLARCHGGITHSDQMKIISDGTLLAFFFEPIRFETRDGLACKTQEYNQASWYKGRLWGPDFSHADCYDANNRQVEINCP